MKRLIRIALSLVMAVVLANQGQLARFTQGNQYIELAKPVTVEAPSE